MYTFHSVYTFLYPVDAKNSELVCIHLFWQICPNASIGKNSSENLWKPLKSDNICLPLSARCWIFWIGLDWSTLLLFWEIAAKLCFCTNATSSNYFRTHQFGRQEVVWENLSLFFFFGTQKTFFFKKKDEICSVFFVVASIKESLIIIFTDLHFRRNSQSDTCSVTDRFLLLVTTVCYIFSERYDQDFYYLDF